VSSETNLSSASLCLLKLVTSLKIYSIALDLETIDADGPQTRTSRLNALSQCLEVTKAAFESVLSMPPTEYHNFSAPEWSRVVYLIVTMFRLCAVTQLVPEWDFGQAQQKSLAVYLESFSFRMGELTTVSISWPSTPDIFSMFKAVLSIVRELYSNLVASLSHNSISATIVQNEETLIPLSQCPIFSSKIEDTDYWSLLEASDATILSQTNQTVDYLEEFDLLSQVRDWDNWDASAIHSQ
jgi:hypothetical protein